MKKVSGATTTVYVFSGTNVIAEYENGAAVGSPTREYIYSGSRLLAKIEAGATRYYFHDHLSARVTSDTTGGNLTHSGHFPFGENWYNTDATHKLKFTSYDRDTASGESGNDYALFRSHVSRLGRFSSPDPLAGDIADPHTLNRYLYVRDDPVNFVDPLGLRLLTECSPYFGCFSHYEGGSWSPGILACGVDPFCIDQGGIGPFDGPVANGGSWANSTYLTGGSYRLVSPLPPGTFVLICNGKSTSSMDCFWSPDSIRYVLNGNLVWMVRDGVGTLDLPLSDSAKQILGDVSRQAGAVTNPKVIAGWYAASAGAALLVRNVQLDGPSPGVYYGNGRVFGVRVGPLGIIRVDLHPIDGVLPILHIHVFSFGGEHGIRIPLHR